MSSFENYDDKSTTYTGMRLALGWQKQLTHFRNNAIPVREQHLIDAGCGTGNYLVHYATEFKAIHGCDFSNGMLEQAAENLEHAKKGGSDVVADVKFSKQNICEMETIPSNTFDALCSNQVIHHFPIEGDFEYVRRAAAQFYRVLKPGGRGVMNCSLPEQPHDSLWWSPLVPEAVAKCCERLPSENKLREILHSAGFQSITIEPQYEEILYNPELYLNPKNFLDIDNFRRSDLTFTLCTDEEIKQAVRKLETLINANELDAWFQTREEERKKIGQSVNVYFVKPPMN